MRQPAQQQPTQSQHPWRATARTVAAAVVGLAILAPTVTAELGVQSVPWVAGTLATIAAVTRVLAIPGVEVWMKRWLPWLAAQPVRHNDNGRT